MIENVVKRDGRLEKFNPMKIEKAVSAAFTSVGRKLPDKVIESFVNQVIEGLPDPCGVEEIQNKVENELMRRNCFSVAKAYILYREKHKEDRILKDRLSYMMGYIKSSDNAATSSEEDSNANVSTKNVANLNGETYKNLNRRLQRMWMRNKLKEMFPEVAKQYEKDLENHIIYTHDESSFSVPTNYCEAVSLYPLLLHGTSTMDGLRTTPPKNLNSFCGQLVNLTFLLAAQCKGAVAFGEFFNFFDYFCVKEWGDNWDSLLEEKASSGVNNNQKTVRQVIEQAFQQIVFSWNQPAGNRSFQSPFINISYYDSNYWKALFEDFSFPDGSKPEWRRVDLLQKMFMKWFNATRKKTLMAFPVETMALLTDGKDVIDKDYKDFTAEMWHEGHSFFLYLSDSPDSLSSCCRLRNQIEKNEFSFTNGLTGVRTGSCNVITLNLNRIVQDWARNVTTYRWRGENTEKIESHNENIVKAQWHKDNAQLSESLKEYFTNILERIYKYHIAYKTMLYDLEEKGMLTASTAGYISMKDLFSTIGINGLNEAAEFLGIECSDNPEYKKFVKFITSIISEENKKHSTKSFKFNQEFVPAEQLGSRNYNWDKADGYKVPSDRVLYNSYFYLVDNPDTSVLEKLRLHGREYTETLDGGVGCHIGLSDHLSKEQYLYLIDYAIKVGCSYFTFNIPNSECKDCGNIEKIPIEECPVCGSKNISQWTRIIGYLRPIENFDKYRQIEAKRRVYSKDIE